MTYMQQLYTWWPNLVNVYIGLAYFETEGAPNVLKSNRWTLNVNEQSLSKAPANTPDSARARFIP